MLSGLLALLVAQFIGGAGGGFSVKLGVLEFPPLTFTFLRFLLATIIFLPFFLREKNKPSINNWKELFIKSLFFVGNASFFSIGIQYTSAIMGQVLYGLVPILVLIFAFFILREKITKQKIIGLVIAAFGLLFLMEQSAKNADLASLGYPWGNIFVLLGAFCWALYFVFSKQLQEKYSIVTILFSNFLTTVLVLSVMIPFELSVRPFVLTGITPTGIGSLLFVAIFLSVIMSFLLQYGVKRTGAFNASLFQYLGPVFSLVTAIPFLGEHLTPSLIIGAGVIFLGVFLATTYEEIKKRIKPVTI